LPGTISMFICQYSDINFIFRYISDDNEFELSTADVKSVFENIELNNHLILSNIKELIANSIE